MKRHLALLPLLALVGCASVPPPAFGPPEPPPPPDPFAWASRPGDNVITGQVAYRTKAGGAFSCAGGSVGLTPEAPASAERTRLLYGSAERAIETVEAVRQRSAGDGAPPYAEHIRSTRCDAQGRFTFTDLPDGAWFLIVRARPARAKGGEVVIMQKVVATGGGVTALALK